MAKEMNLSLIKKAARKSLGAANSIPVVVRPGSDASPDFAGRSFFFTTPAGKPVQYPNAYRAFWQARLSSIHAGDRSRSRLERVRRKDKA